MILNRFEEKPISKNVLPPLWQSQEALDDLEDFLQKNWEQRAVFYDDGKVDSKQQFLSFIGNQGVRTNNYIGTIVFNGEQLNIYPKVFRPAKDFDDTDELNQKHLMSNLVRWLEYCNKIEYPFISMSAELSAEEDLKELFITLYVGYVRYALDRGLFYQYTEETEDISCIRGKFNIKDYFVRKIPNGQADKFECTYSNFEFDNRVNRIIKCTCKLIMNMSSKRNQKALRDILLRLNEVSDVQCSARDCNGIRLSKMHSYYRIILSMSKMFLLNKTSTFTVDTDESFCFLFPTELLFEGFIGGFMQETIRGVGGKVFLQKSDMKLIDKVIIDGQEYSGAFTMRHDILVEFSDRVFILDTKYKQVSRFEGNPEEALKVVNSEPNQNDVYQVCEYARKRNLQDVYLLYPQFRYEEVDSSKPIGVSKDNNGDINIHFVRLPFVFEDDEQKVKNQLRDVIVQLFEV